MTPRVHQVDEEGDGGEAAERLSQSGTYTQYSTPRMIHGNTLSRRT